MMRISNPDLAQTYFAQVKEERPQAECIQAVTSAQADFNAADYTTPEWTLVWNGARLEQVTD